KMACRFMNALDLSLAIPILDMSEKRIYPNTGQKGMV
ncbi:MAG: hypothetical protein RJB00_708, partial [Actinomycetota bacterium]